MDTYTIKLFEAEELMINGGVITEDIVLPADPSNGDLALLINQNPSQPFSRENDAWVEKQFVKIGQAQKLSDLLGTPISYAFNGNYRTVIEGVLNSQLNLLNHNIGSNDFFVKKLRYSDTQNNKLVEFGLDSLYQNTGRGVWLVDSTKTSTYFSKSTADGWVFFYLINDTSTLSNAGNFIVELQRSF